MDPCQDDGAVIYLLLIFFLYFEVCLGSMGRKTSSGDRDAVKRYKNYSPSLEINYFIIYKIQVSLAY